MRCDPYQHVSGVVEVRLVRVDIVAVIHKVKLDELHGVCDRHVVASVVHHVSERDVVLFDGTVTDYNWRFVGWNNPRLESLIGQ